MSRGKLVLFALTGLVACGPPDGAVSVAAPAVRGGAAHLEDAATNADPGALGALEESDLANQEGILYGPFYDSSGDRGVWVRRADQSPWTELVTTERITTGWKTTVLVGGSNNPDRPAIAADGETIAFVAGLTGIASVWTLPFDGTADPVQHTNVGLHLVKRAPGEAPPGFVPPPSNGSLVFAGDLLQWEGPDGTHQVRWR